MIKLNLLSANLIKKEERNELFILAVLLASIIVFCCLVNYGFKFYELKKQENKIEKVNRELAKYESLVRQLEALQATKTALETKKNLINALTATGLTYPRFMEKLMDVLPDNIWFKTINTKLLNETELNIDISAEALDNFSIADFLGGLMSDTAFSKIELGAINTLASDRGDTFAFRISFNYKKEITK